MALSVEEAFIKNAPHTLEVSLNPERPLSIEARKG
jgi:hypothetical protein